MKITLLWLTFLTILSCALLAQEQPPAPEGTAIFREAFTLKLRVDKRHYYEEHFDKIPYVAGSAVYLFGADHFGVNLTDTKAQFLTVSCQPDTGKADVLFAFT